MELTVCAARYERLVITPHALAMVEFTSAAEEWRRLGSALFGGAVAELAGDAPTLLGSGRMGFLNLAIDVVPPLPEMMNVTRCFASEVPEDLARSPGWPRVESLREVVFYPRVVIEFLTLSWTCRLRASVSAGEAELSMRLGLLSVRKARGALQKWGYPLRVA